MICQATVGHTQSNIQQKGQFQFQDAIAIYQGRIDESIENFIAEANQRHIEKLSISSHGGDAHYGIMLGSWIHEKKIPVEVNFICVSACANYVFTAAPMKTIGRKALVVWHGSAEQKNFREEEEQYQALLVKSKAGQATVKEQEFLAREKSAHDKYVQIRAEQKTFFEKIKVNEYITRLGQEPVNHQAVWTATVGLMHTMGIDNVSAPPEYGTADYLRGGLSILFGNIIVFDVDQQGKIVALGKQ
jgi:hypothetical protein